MLAASSASPDGDRGLYHGADGGGDMGGGAANGASGFKLVGTLVGAFAHSRVVATGFGSYGAAVSVYSHFLAKGRDVVYPKNMSMVLELGTREKTASESQYRDALGGFARIVAPQLIQLEETPHIQECVITS